MDIDIICRQTNYTREEALEKMLLHKDPIKVIKEYMGIKEKEPEPKQFYREINNFMDLKLTGSLEKVMSESVHVAQTLAWDLTPNDRKETINQLNNKKSICYF